MTIHTEAEIRSAQNELVKIVSTIEGQLERARVIAQKYSLPFYYTLDRGEEKDPDWDDSGCSEPYWESSDC